MTHLLSDPFVIAEIGINHNGSLDQAISLIHAAKHCGASAVKFQYFSASRLVSPSTPVPEYQKKCGSLDQKDLLERYELKLEQLIALKGCSDELGLEFMCSAFSSDDLIELLEAKLINRIKIPSGEATDLLSLKVACRSSLPIILSTGLITSLEYHSVVDYIQHNSSATLCPLHCISSYPADESDTNLLSMPALALNPRVNQYGLSDHSLSTKIPVYATLLGASVIEKHLTSSRYLEGPDHMSSLEPFEFRQMVDDLKNLGNIMGSPCLLSRPVNTEIRHIATKSLATKCAIPSGQIIQESHLQALRPGSGVSPLMVNNYVGQPSVRDYLPGEFL